MSVSGPIGWMRSMPWSKRVRLSRMNCRDLVQSADMSHVYKVQSEDRGMAEQQNEPDNIYLTLNRVINAPVETVYAAWTDPDMLRQWLAPGDAIVTRAVTDLVVGGTFLIEMRGADGRRFVTRGIYREIVANRRLVHTWRWEGSDVESLVTVEFEPESAGTLSLASPCPGVIGLTKSQRSTTWSMFQHRDRDSRHVSLRPTGGFLSRFYLFFNDPTSRNYVAACSERVRRLCILHSGLACIPLPSPRSRNPLI